MDRDPARRYAVRFCFLLLALAGLVILNIGAGSVSLGPEEAFRALLSPGGEDLASGIVWNLRLPRLIEAAILGGALSVSGFLLQTFFHNPIAGPYVLGISSGARLTAALAMIAALERDVPLRPMGLVAAALWGSFLSMAAVLIAADRARSPSMLIVCGVMIGYACTAATDLVLTFADERNIVNLRGWSQGSFSGADWPRVGAATAVILPAACAAWLLSKPLGAYQLGEEYARSVGVEIRRFRAAVIVISGVLSATAAAFAGPVSFVGIAVPYLMKRLFGTAKPLVIIPACFLGGGVFCLLCDCAARTLFAPADIGISTVTAVFGVPVVLHILLNRPRRG